MANSLPVRADSGNIKRRKLRPPTRGHRTLRECGEVLGISHERARQIEQRALAKLRKAILDDADLSALAAHLFGDEVLTEPLPELPQRIEVRREGFFEPPAVKIVGSEPTDVAATLVEALRVCGPSTPSQLHVAVELPMATITTWLHELCDRGVVRIIFKGHKSQFALTEVRR